AAVYAVSLYRQRIVSGARDGSIKLWDVRESGGPSTAVVANLEEKSGIRPLQRAVQWSNNGIRAVQWSKDGQTFAVGSESGVLALFDQRNLSGTLCRLSSPLSRTTSVAAIDWHPSGSRLAVGGREMSFRVWDYSAGSLQLHTTVDMSGAPKSLA